MKNLNKLFLLFSFLAFAQLTHAQTPAPETGRILGTVVDSTSQRPVSYATVGLVNAQSGQVVNGMTTDDKGSFVLDRVAVGEYRLEISFVGYRNKSQGPIRVTSAQPVVNVGAVRLGPSLQALKEVVIEGQRAMIEERVDRTVYNAENDPTNRGGDAAEVLRKVPMLSVDMDGNVSLRGSSNVRVLINNKPSTIVATSVADALKQIPADMIKTVEVITSPSARYDAEGSAGIINIITKKDTIKGFSLGTDLSAGLRGSNLRLNGSMRTGKMGFNVGGFGRLGYNIKGAFENAQETVRPNNGVDTRFLNTQNAETRSNMGFGRYQFGWDYDINKNNVIVASVRYGFQNSNRYQDLLQNQTFQNGVPIRNQLSNVHALDNSGTWDVNLDFTHTFARPQHEFSILTLYSRNNRTNDFRNFILNPSDFTTMNQFSLLNESFNEEMTVQFDYQNPIAENQMMELGVKNITRKVTSDQAGSRSLFNYNQDVQAAYLAYTLTFLESYSLKAGARYENTTIGADFQGEQAGFTIPNYGILVPSINLSKKLANGNTIKGGYNRRIQRPSLQFLNPNLQATNPLNATIGNPELDPELTDNFELSYNTFIKNTFLTFTGYMRTTNNAIEAVRDVLPPDTIRTTYQNIGQQDAYGVSVFGNVNLSNKFTLNGGFDTYYTFLTNNNPDPIYAASNQGLVYNVRMMGNYRLPKNWAVQLFSFYRGRSVQLQGYQGGFGIYSLNLNREFNNKKGSIGFGAENFFTPTIRVRSVLESPVINQTSTNVMYNTNFKINFSYRIGKMSAADAQPRRRRKSVTNDDMKGGGGGDGADSGAGAPAAGGSPVTGGAPAMMEGGAPGAPRPAATSGQGTPNQRTGQAVDGQSQPTDSTQTVNPTGVWSGTIGQFEVTLNLQADGETLTGNMVRPQGEVAISDGKINGNQITFSVAFGPNVVPYSGRINGDQLQLFANFMCRDVEGLLNRKP